MIIGNTTGVESISVDGEEALVVGLGMRRAIRGREEDSAVEGMVDYGREREWRRQQFEGRRMEVAADL